jgi:hypothetical protein
MIDLNLIIVVAAWLAVVVSIWFIVYFSARIITHYWVRRELGDMPSAEEISRFYKINNAMIDHSPIDENLRS